jgi:acyl-coenzyme A synthetase/AMP-(fatty) acid ligase
MEVLMHPLIPEYLQAEYRERGYWGGPTVAELAAAQAGENPDRQLLVGPEPTTYAELDLLGRRLAGGLRERGVRRGDRVVIAAETSRATFALHLAASRLGLIMAPLAASTSPRRALGVTSHVSARVLVLLPDAKRATAWTEFAAHLQDAAMGAELVVSDLELPGCRLPQVGYGELAGGYPADVFESANDEVSVILSSGGTTGTPKAIMQSGNAFTFSARSIVHALDLGPSDVYMVTGPYGHLVSAWAVYVPLLTGGSALPVPRWKVADATRDIARYGVTFGTITATHAFDFLQLAAGEEKKLRSVRCFIAAGKPDGFFGEFERRFGIPLLRAYGQSEMPVHTLVELATHDSCGESDGWPEPGVDLRLVVPGTNETAADGEPGEALIRGPGMFHGYYGAEAATRNAVTEDGFYRSGDLLRVDESGYRVTGRLGDMIRRGGLNIDPSNTEELLLGHESVSECVVVGLPDEALGERAAAAVVLNASAHLDLESASSYLLAQGLPTAYFPEAVFVLATLPRTEVGKYDRGAVRAELARLVKDQPALLRTR